MKTVTKLYNETCSVELIKRITLIADVCNGKLTFRSLRITVKTILEFLAAGETAENILKAYPDLEADDIRASLQYPSLIADQDTASYRIEKTSDTN